MNNSISLQKRLGLELFRQKETTTLPSASVSQTTELSTTKHTTVKSTTTTEKETTTEDRKSTRLNSSHKVQSRMPSSA